MSAFIPPARAAIPPLTVSGDEPWPGFERARWMADASGVELIDAGALGPFDVENGPGDRDEELRLPVPQGAARS